MDEIQSTILIVDDEPSNRETLVSILEPEGYRPTDSQESPVEMRLRSAITIVFEGEKPNSQRYGLFRKESRPPR